MDKLLNIAMQWSTVRGVVVLIATSLGAAPIVAAAGAEVIDQVVAALPAVGAAAVGLYDVMRDEKGEQKGD